MFLNFSLNIEDNLISILFLYKTLFRRFGQFSLLFANYSESLRMTYASFGGGGSHLVL